MSRYTIDSDGLWDGAEGQLRGVGYELPAVAVGGDNFAECFEIWWWVVSESNPPQARAWLDTRVTQIPEAGGGRA